MAGEAVSGICWLVMGRPATNVDETIGWNQQTTSENGSATTW